MIFDLIAEGIRASLDILNDASVWLVLSFVLAGGLHDLLRPEILQKMLANRGIPAILRGTCSGMLLPVCSCGVIPLGLGLYYSGAYLGPTLAFMTATPIINPAAVILAYGLLGPQIATIYLVGGFIVPVIAGVLGNALAGPELCAPGIEDGQARAELEAEKAGFGRKLLAGLRWGFVDLGVMVSKYVVLGVLLAGFILAVVPKEMIQQYLGSPGLISLAGIAVLGSIMYVCAVGHIPFIAALVAAGAAPGVAITFLMTGAATNLPELLSIYKLIGLRAVVVYTLTLVGASMLIGYITNTVLLRDFVPFFDHAHSSHMVGIANKLIFAAPKPVQYLFSGIIAALCVYAFLPRVQRFFAAEQPRG